MTQNNSHWSNSYIGLPYADLGRDRSGVDCWGLFRLVMAEQNQIDLPSYVDGYAGEKEKAEISALINGAKSHSYWNKVRGDFQSFDAVIFRRGVQDSHVGVAVSPTKFLHVVTGGDVRIEDITVGRWAARLVGAWRHSDIGGASS